MKKEWRIGGMNGPLNYVQNGQALTLCITEHLAVTFFEKVKTWSSLVEGDEKPDRPNSQIDMECCHACAAYFFVLS